MGPTTGWRR